MKTDSEGKNAKKPIFGASSLQTNQGDASRLVGGIVEKGFSGQAQNRPLIPPSAPRPSVLPFPVARHRSHGPHWTAIGGGINGNGEADDDDDDREGDDKDSFSGFEQVMDFAKPVQRKEKKGLDFTGWREIVATGDSSASNKQVKRKHTMKSKQNIACQLTKVSDELNKPAIAVEGDLQLSRRAFGDDSKVHHLDRGYKVLKEREIGFSDMAIDIERQSFQHSRPTETFVQQEGRSTIGTTETKEEILIETGLGPVKMDNEMEVETRMQYKSTNSMTSGFGSYKVADEHGNKGLESQIDSENRARLEKMSAEEIAEAQAEIVAKMSPALVDALKKRGQDKLKMKKCLGSDTVADGEMRNLQAESNLISASTLSDFGSFRQVMEEGARGVLDDHGGPNFCPKNSSLWDSWSKRVEDVRELRFSLDGDIIRSDLAQACSTDNVSERDFLRTEGDPAAAGYTIKEAVALTRSVVPGQRALSLHLLNAVLHRALHNILQNKAGCTLRFAETGGVTDSEAIWAFALGPEPELALSLRICLDDNHNSVVLACTKVIGAVLSCDVNESFFNISEKIASIQDDVSTAAVFRTKPEIDVGFLHGGFWKYNTKPSNVLPFADNVDDKHQGEHTIQDDVVITGQDVAAGFVRMGSLPRIQYLLEAEPSPSLEESLLSILIAIARHSPTCAAAIMKCQRLVLAVVNRFTTGEQMEINPSKIKSVSLLKVLARIDKKNCVEFIKNGVFQKVTWHLFRYSSLDQWMKSGRDASKLSSALLVEQLRLWKVCIKYGYCVSYFADLFPALSIWLTVPTFEKLVENNILSEFAAISREVYLVLEALTKRLPNFYSPMHQRADATAEELETWSWSHVGPLIDLALKWTMVKNIPPLSRLFDLQKGDGSYNMLQDSTIGSLLWVVSSAMHMLSGVLEVVIPGDSMDMNGGLVPWLPEFVPKIGLTLIKNGYFHFSGIDVSNIGDNLTRGGSFLECLCHLRHKCGQETSIASASCLQGLFQVVVFVDKLIRLAKPEMTDISSQHHSFSREDKVLADGILQSALAELETLLRIYMMFTSNWHCAESIEMFSRGGPAPGVGVGWGASGGGFWSTTILLAQVDARFITFLFEIFQNFVVEDPITVEQLHSSLQRINSALEACLTVGPRDRSVVDKLFDILFQVPVLKCLDFGINKFLELNQGFKTFVWKYEEEEYLRFCNLLASHFKSRWLSDKKKHKDVGESQHVSQSVSKKGNVPLDTIYEEMGASNINNNGATSLAQEWAHQRLPLPNHWFLSPISATHYGKKPNLPSTSVGANYDRAQAGFAEVAQAGLFFLLGLESMSDLLTAESHSSVQNVPVVWKVHALSVMLVDGMGVLENEKSRDVYETLQNVYGQLIDKSTLLDTGERVVTELLRFQSQVHESYSTFVEMLVEQFAAVSYGDLVFGRQIAIYLHRCVEASVRLAAWSALSNARALELLPPLEMCFSKAVGYLAPIEDDEKILEAYAKSWVSGALDKAAIRSSASYTLVLHHLASFIFGDCFGDKFSLRNQLVKSLLRDYSHKRHHEGMMMNLLQYKKPTTSLNVGVEDASLLQICEVEKRFQLLREACEGNSSLVNEVAKLECCMRNDGR